MNAQNRAGCAPNRIWPSADTESRLGWNGPNTNGPWWIQEEKGPERIHFEARYYSCPSFSNRGVVHCSPSSSDQNSAAKPVLFLLGINSKLNTGLKPAFFLLILQSCLKRKGAALSWFVPLNIVTLRKSYSHRHFPIVTRVNECRALNFDGRKRPWVKAGLVYYRCLNSTWHSPRW